MLGIYIAESIICICSQALFTSCHNVAMSLYNTYFTLHLCMYRTFSSIQCTVSESNFSHPSCSFTLLPSASTAKAQVTCLEESLFGNFDISGRKVEVASARSGQCFSVILDFHLPILLTDVCIPTNPLLSSVTVDVWLTEGEPPSRVLHAKDLSCKSVSLGNLSPPPLCQFAKVGVTLIVCGVPLLSTVCRRGVCWIQWKVGRCCVAPSHTGIQLHCACRCMNQATLHHAHICMYICVTHECPLNPTCSLPLPIFR